MSVEKFLKEISEVAERFKSERPEKVKVVCHRGTDGLIGAALMVRLLSNMEVDFCVSALKLLDYQSVLQLSIEGYEHYIFVGFGTESIELIEDLMKKKKEVIIFDHHTPKVTKSSRDVLCPSFFGIKSYKEVTSAGIVYLFCSVIDKSCEEVAWLPAVSIISELGYGEELSDINASIFKAALDNGSVRFYEGIRMLAFHSLPVYQALSLSVEPYLPGISSNGEGAIQFLNGLGISIRKSGGVYKTLFDIVEDDANKVVAALMIRRLGIQRESEEVMGRVYVLSDPKAPVADLIGFGILLRACGYLNSPSVAIGLCLGGYSLKEKSLSLLEEYVRELVSAMDWFNVKMRSDMRSGDNFVFFNAESTIKENTLSSVVSIIARSNLYRPGFVIVGCCHTFDDKVKVSARVVGAESSSVDLLGILKVIIKRLGDGSTGGHKNAAGATVDIRLEKEFEEIAGEVLKKKAIEESIV